MKFMKFTLFIAGILLLMLLAMPAILLAQTPVPIEDLFTQLIGVQGMVTIGIIITITSIIKALFKPGATFLKYIVLVPLILAGLYAWFLGGFQEVTLKIEMAFSYAAAAAYLYSLGGNVAKVLTNKITGKQVFTKVK
jgi:hypothetical protein